MAEQRRSSIRAAGSILAAATLTTSGLAIRSAPLPAHAAGQTLYVARDLSDGKTMDPGHFYEFTSNAMATNSYDTLVTFTGSDNANPKPDLADLPTVSGGGEVYTFKLHKGVKFASGNPLTADDVVFSYRRLLYLNDNPSFLVAGVSSFKALDSSTVQITLSAPDVSFVSALATNNFGVLDSKLVIAHGGDDSKDAAKKDKAQSFLDTQSAGTGAFQMTNWARDNQIVMQRNPNYWGAKPFFDQIIFQNVADAATQRLQVQKGSVDVAMNINLQQAASLGSGSGVKVVKGNTLDLVYIGMTTSATVSKPLSDPRVRQAVRYAIDYDGILKGLLRGVGTRPNTMIPVGMLGNEAAFNDATRIKQDIGKAKALLIAAGYPSGFPVTLSYDTNTTFDGVTYDPLANKLQNDLAQVGIKVTLQPQKDAVLLPAYRAQKLQMILYNWGVDYPDPNDYAGPFSPGGGPAKRMWYTTNKALTATVTQADSTTDVAKRVALYHSVQKTWLQESPWIGLIQPQNIIVLGSNIKGYTYNAVLPSNFRTTYK